jgi:hypothetical protein
MFSNAVAGGRLEAAPSLVSSDATGGSSKAASETALGLGATGPGNGAFVSAAAVSSGTSGFPSGATVAGGRALTRPGCVEKAAASGVDWGTDSEPRFMVSHSTIPPADRSNAAASRSFMT